MMGAHDRYWCSVYERLCMSVGLTINHAERCLPLRGPQRDKAFQRRHPGTKIMYAVVFLYCTKIAHLCHKMIFLSQTLLKYPCRADGPSCSDSRRMILNVKQCFSIYQQKSKEEKVKTFHFNYVIAQKPRLPSQKRVKKGGFEGVSLGLFTQNFHLSLT